MFEVMLVKLKLVCGNLELWIVNLPWVFGTLVKEYSYYFNTVIFSNTVTFLTEAISFSFFQCRPALMCACVCMHVCVCVRAYVMCVCCVCVCVCVCVCMCVMCAWLLCVYMCCVYVHMRMLGMGNIDVFAI